MNSLLVKEYTNIIESLQNIDRLKNKSICITGATGLIGSYLTDFLIYLNEEFNYNIEINTVSRSAEKLQKRFDSSKVNMIEQDLNKAFNITKNFDYIIHAASNAHPLAFSKDPVGTMKTNIQGTISLLESIKTSNSKFLYFSTGEIYGNNIDKAFNENDCGLVDTKLARSCYPESKRAAETLCIAYHQQFGINVNIARLCYVYGHSITDENSRADAQFLRNAINKEDIVLKSKGEQKRTYCYVADAVNAVLHILLNGIDGEVYNIANPNCIVTIKEYAQTLSQLAGVNLKFELPDEIEKAGYSKPADSVLDSSKLINSGWHPIYNLKEGLENTLNIKKEQMSLC